MKKLISICWVAVCMLLFGSAVRSSVAGRQSMMTYDGGKEPLPEGVVAIEYIESSTFQWHQEGFYDTGIIPSIDTEIIVDCAQTGWGGTGWLGICGSASSDGATDSFYLRMGGQGPSAGGTWPRYCGTVDGKSMDNRQEMFVAEGTRVVCSLSKSALMVGDVSLALNATAFQKEPSYSMYLFEVNIAGIPWYPRQFVGRIWECVVKDGGAVVARFIPVRIADNGANVPCFYDTVGKVLIYPQGGNVFSCGPDLR